MRRKDREMNREFGYQVMDKARFGVVSMMDENNQPYGIPLSVAREGNALYFHSAMEGKKVDIFAGSPSVSIVFVGDVKVPELYREEELEEMAKDETKASLLIRKVFTTEFESAMARGRVEKVTSEEERLQGMKVICNKFTPTKMAYFEAAAKAGLYRANVYKLEMEEVTAKRKKYDAQGNEIKQAASVES